MSQMIGWYRNSDKDTYLKMSLQALGNCFCTVAWHCIDQTIDSFIILSGTTNGHLYWWGWTQTDWYLKSKVARLYKSCFNRQSWSPQLAVNNGSCLEVDSSTGSQSICGWVWPLWPEHFSVWSDHIGFGRNLILARCCSFLWNELCALKRASSNIFKGEIFFFWVCLLFWDCACSRVWLFGIIPDKASVSHEKVNIMVYIQICHRLWDKLTISGMSVFRKIRSDWALSLYFFVLVCGQFGEADRKKAENQTRKCHETNFCMSRLWPFLAPNEQDAAGSLVILAPPPTSTCLACAVIWIPPMWQKNEAGRKRAKAMMHTTPTRHILCRI